MLIIASICALLFASVSLASSAEDDLQRLAVEGNGVIRLNPETFELLTSPKRTWSASVHLTALQPQRRCHPCQQFDPAWRAVAKSWSQVPARQRNQHFFATVDFDEAPSVFQQLALVSAPVLLSYPAAVGDRKPANGKISPTKYDFTDGFDAGPLAQVISRFTPIPVPYNAPIDWTRFAVTAISALGIILLLRSISPIIQNKWSWAFVTVVIMLIMTSGFMYALIRGVPFSGPNGEWIAAGYQNQVGKEVHLISFIYGLLSFSLLMLILVVPHQSSPQKQRMQIFIWTGVTVILYSVLVSLFKIKNRGYPFKIFL